MTAKTKPLLVLALLLVLTTVLTLLQVVQAQPTGSNLVAAITQKR